MNTHKYSEFGESLRVQREKRNLEQSALAKALGITQQTVSRWEKGDSRPKTDMVHKIAELFDDNADEWLIRASYKIDKPVRPLLSTLPLEKLSEEDFEFFNVDFIQKLHPRASVHRYGHRGHKQNGIDLYAKVDGKKSDYQVKRHQQFGKSKVDKAVQDTTMKAEHHHILLSRQASPEARDAIDQYDDWSLWDVEDISRKVRSLPIQDRLDLIDTYFPAYRKDFLGIDEPSPWLTPEKYYRPFNDKLRLFNHDWDFNGRTKELADLLDFARNSADQVLLLIGRGGVGKTRLLKELATTLRGEIDVRFMTQRAEPTLADIEKLPTKGLLIVEDIHEYGDLKAMLSRIAIERPGLKIIASSRPYGQTFFEDQLLDAGMSFTPEDTVELGDMSLKNAIALAKQIIPDDEVLTRRIAEITLDCPLATVLGARLVANGEIRPDILNNSNKFRKHLMKSFRDVVTGRIGGLKDADTIKELLDLVAVLQPVDITDPGFENVVEAIISRPYDKVIRDLSALEDAGVILRRKSGLRIAPDLLADFIRAEATFSLNSKSSTRYADRVFKATKGELATNLIVNLSQLDWRLSADGYQATLLSSVWEDLKQQFLASEINGRISMLKGLEKVAYYQPAETLSFARLALDKPINIAETTEFDELFDKKTTYNSVIVKLPELIKLAAHNGRYLPESLELLKEITGLVGRPERRPSEHPVSVMKSLIALTPQKPVGFIDLGVSHVLSWLSEDTINFSPFDVLDGALITEGHDTQFKGKSLIMNTFKVRVDAVEEIRNKIIDAAFSAIGERNPKLAVRAIGSLVEALRGPMQDATPEDKAKWEPGQLKLLKRLEAIAADSSLDPFISVEVRRAVNWHSNFSKSATRDAANKVLKAIPDSLDYNLARALADGWGWSFERGQNFEREEASFHDWKNNHAVEVIQDFTGKEKELVGILEERINTLENLEITSGDDGSRFIHELVSRSADLRDCMSAHVLKNQSSSLAKFLSTLITTTATSDYDKAIQLAEDALKNKDVMTQRRVAQALGWLLSENQPPSQRELTLIGTLLDSDDKITKRNLTKIVRRFPDERKMEALDLLISIDFSDDESTATEVLGEFNKEHGSFEFEQLTPEQLDRIFDQLIKLKTIDDYWVQEFIQDASYYYPERVLRLLFDRVDCKADLDFKRGYYPIPAAWERRETLRINETPQYQSSLEQIRDWMNDERDDWHRHQYGPEIFRAVATGYDDAVTLKVLNDMATSDDSGQVEAAATLLSEFPVAVLWDNPDRFVAMLEHADELGESTYKHVSSSLHSMSFQGERTGVVGEPFPQDILQYEKSKEMLKVLPKSSAAINFYQSLMVVADKAIRQARIEDEEEEE